MPQCDVTGCQPTPRTTPRSTVADRPTRMLNDVPCRFSERLLPTTHVAPADRSRFLRRFQAREFLKEMLFLTALFLYREDLFGRPCSTLSGTYTEHGTVLQIVDSAVPSVKDTIPSRLADRSTSRDLDPVNALWPLGGSSVSWILDHRPIRWYLPWRG